MGGLGEKVKGAFDGVELKDFMWGVEMYLFEHQEAKADKHVAMSLKGFLDADVFTDKEFISYYEEGGDKVNKSNPGHNLLMKAKGVAEFVEWLKDDSDSDSGSGSDSD